jgi:hypothetical protein
LIYLVDKATMAVVGSVNGTPSLSDLAAHGIQAVESDLTASPHRVKIIDENGTLKVIEKPYIEVAIHSNGLRMTATATVRKPSGSVMLTAEGEICFHIKMRNNDEAICAKSAPIAYGRAKIEHELDEPGSYLVEAEHPEYVMQIVPIYISKEVH